MKPTTESNLSPELFGDSSTNTRLLSTLDGFLEELRLEWSAAADASPFACARVRLTEHNELTWKLEHQGACETRVSTAHRMSIRARLNHFRKRFPVADEAISFGRINSTEAAGQRQPQSFEPIPFDDVCSPWTWIEVQIVHLARQMRIRFSPLVKLSQFFAHSAEFREDEFLDDGFRDETRRSRREDRQQRMEAERVRQMVEQRRYAEQQARKKQMRQAREAERKAAEVRKALERPPPCQRAPIPPVSLAINLPPLEFQNLLFPETDLRPYFLLERACLWWVSNQSDDLLCFPHCRLERLDYQIRTALRVIGPLRGRALLSDEVGLGKTIEAGLVLKEYSLRGMVKRFLVLTVPSLVDQWEEELLDKFDLKTATTNHPVFRADPAAFWRDNRAIVASLHTVKQPAHLAHAQKINWDMLIVDEAHYLRNHSSQAWQTVNALPRQFLLLLTATPVQNSLEDLYNLVTLLQPGQLPSPREFRSRFVNRERPNNPREPEELRRLLGQVMIRNTRSNAGIHLPPRRAETVIFEADATERDFWQGWEAELRAKLAALNANQASLWGRLLLQTAGSSPAAWLDALRSFPDTAAARCWRERAPLDGSWRKKCDLIGALMKADGSLVVFTQFLRTQAALAEHLKVAGGPVWVINGQTPPPERQPITEQFKKQGGALLLTHSGTEGRNLQFCHRLVNFDLPWNPMEIEQRIGRLHRLGQKRPVEIYNLVQSSTLQEHLLQVLQEKLNLFELVVGETGLILGDRFPSNEFADEVFRRWRDSDGLVAEALQKLGDELAAARVGYEEVKQIDATLFSKDYETL
ncbi:MAG: DEAD/DEAH box helicase family protein [Verrucomicrobia bacterium]|nr:DEAD/DEAH box helicase family protein [Verrucomicrobiota bacterium]